MPQKRLRRAITLGLGTVALTAASLVAAPPASAAIPMCPMDSWCLYTYYGEPEKVTYVGESYTDCDNNRDTRGRMTPWVTLMHGPC